MKILLLLILPFQTFAQIDSLPDIQILFSKIDSFYFEKSAAEKEEYQEFTKNEYLKYIPAIGVAYTPSGSPRPSVSFSTSIIYQASKEKQFKKAKIHSIEKLNDLAARQEKQELKELFQIYYLRKNDLSFYETILDIDLQLFAIQQDKFDREEILPDAYLKSKKTYLEKEYLMKTKVQEINQLRINILRKGKYF